MYLKLQSTRLALSRIAARVRQGGHDVPRLDVIRRFTRGWENFERVYRPLANVWTVYDNSGRASRRVEKSCMKIKRTAKTAPTTAAKVGRAL